MSGDPVSDPAHVEAYWARRRAREHLVLACVMHVFLVVGMAAAFFAGGDLGLLVSGCLALLALVTTGDIIRTGFRAFALPTDPTPARPLEDRP